MEYTLKFVNTHTRRTYRHFFPCNSVIRSCRGTQQGDPEYPILFSNSTQDLIDSLESNANLWCLDDGNLGVENRIVLEDLTKIVEAENTQVLKKKPTMQNVFTLRHH